MKSSLAAQLALLSDVAPVDSKDDAQDDLLRAFPVRSDQHQDMDDDFNEEDDAEEEDEDDDDQGDDNDGEDEDVEDMEGMDDSEGEFDDGDEDQGEDQDDDQDDDEDEEEDGEDDDSFDEDDASSQNNGGSTHALSNQAAESAALIKSLKAETAAAAQRGRAIKRQQRDWDAALELRIRAQKVVRAGMRIETQSISPFLSHPSALKRGAPDQHASLLQNLDALSASLFVLRARLLEQSHPSDVKLPQSLSVQHFQAQRERARKRAKLDSNQDQDDVDEEQREKDTESAHTLSLENLFALESRILDPLASSILNGAHSKLNAANTSSSNAASKGATSKFKNVSVTPSEQIETSFSNAESKRRLVERTQVWRGEETRLRLPVPAAEKGVADAVDPTASSIAASSRALELDAFDDSDMYSHLLRELIESKGGRASTSASIPAGGVSSADGDGSQGFNADLTLLAPGLLNGGKKVKRTVDTRASKGRKIRYEVNEKIANFMPPVPRLLWDEDQIDRLFSKLNARLGDQDVIKRTRAVAEEDKDQEEQEVDAGGAESTNIIDGLQLFG